MPLRDVQTAFMQAVFGKDDAGIAPYLADARRLQVYRNNVYAALTKALQAIYPVVLRLVDEPFFHYAADHYIERYPSRSGDLNNYGAHFAAFIGEFEPATQIPYLPDVARLEWCCHRAYLAADDATLDLQKLAALPPESHGGLRFRLNSSCHLLRSAWPIDAIWRVNQDGYQGDQAVDLDKGGVMLLIQRAPSKISVLPLSAAEWSFLSGIAEQQSLATLFERTRESDPGALLQKFVARETLAAFSPSVTR